jgi:hypothetical protein
MYAGQLYAQNAKSIIQGCKPRNQPAGQPQIILAGRTGSFQSVGALRRLSMSLRYRFGPLWERITLPEMAFIRKAAGFPCLRRSLCN